VTERGGDGKKEREKNATKDDIFVGHYYFEKGGSYNTHIL